MKQLMVGSGSQDWIKKHNDMIGNVDGCCSDNHTYIGTSMSILFTVVIHPNNVTSTKIDPFSDSG